MKARLDPKIVVASVARGFMRASIDTPTPIGISI
jgi:hypothetical protein